MNWIACNIVHLTYSCYAVRSFIRSRIPSWIGVIPNSFSTFQTKFEAPFLRVDNISILSTLNLDTRLLCFRGRSSCVNPTNIKMQSLRDNKDRPTGDKVQNSLQSINVNNMTFKSTAEKQYQHLGTELSALNNRVEQIKNEDWEALKSSVLDLLGTIDKGNIDAVIMNMCSDLQCLSLGKSFFKYLKSIGRQINLATYGNYMRLFYNCSSNCTDSDLDEIHAIYRELLQNYPVLDSSTAEKAVSALSITTHWKEYSLLFKSIEKFCYPSIPVYSIVIKAAFQNKEFDIGWKLMEELQYQGRNTPDELFIFWLDMVKDNRRDEDLLRVLQFLRMFSITPFKSLCDTIKQIFEESRNNRKATFTVVSRSGECKSCHAKLEPAWVCQEDYEQLKTTFLNRDIIGKDIFQRTLPEEFNAFLQFIEKTAPYDVVLDGLNIALRVHKTKKSPSAYAFKLRSVVKHFASQNKRILVFGRKHMTQWPQADMKYVYDNSNVFLAENISQDDPFLLYAALYSGLGTRFMSQDMMRGHKFLLTNPKIQATFLKWQAQHQYFLRYIEDNGTVHLQEPVSFMQRIQQNCTGDWHIPYLVKENLTNKSPVDTLHRHWLCLVNQPRQQAVGYRTLKESGHQHKYNSASIIRTL